jgi:hypothetical protein
VAVVVLVEEVEEEVRQLLLGVELEEVVRSVLQS